MANLIAKVSEHFQMTDALVTFIGTIVLGIYVFMLTTQALQPLSPIITFLVAFVLTLHAMMSGKFNAGMAITGLAVYLLSWPATHQFGEALGVITFLAGFLLWLTAVTRSYPRAWASITA